jgi:hypothetical protein
MNLGPDDIWQVSRVPLVDADGDGQLDIEDPMVKDLPSTFFCFEAVSSP